MSQPCSHEGTFDTQERSGDGDTAVCRVCGLEVPIEYALPPSVQLNMNTNDRHALHRPEWRTGGNGAGGDGEYMRRHTPVRRTVMSPYVHIVRHPGVLSKAAELYHEVTQADILRKNSRRGVIFACIFYAYRIYDQLRTPDELSVELDVNKRVISRGLKFVTLRLQSFGRGKPKGVLGMGQHVTPFHYFPTLWRKIGMAFAAPVAQELVVLFKSLHMQNALLNRSNPQSVACAMVYYYLCQKESEVTCSQLSKLVGLSVVTINRLAVEITRHLGTESSVALK